MLSHYEQAEKLIDDAESCEAGGDGWPIYFREAQVHATLALVQTLKDIHEDQQVLSVDALSR